MRVRFLRIVLPAVRWGLVIWLLVGAAAVPPNAASATTSVRAEAGSAAVPSVTWARNLEPVVMSAASLPAFAGAPIHDLFAYEWVTGAWQQIPFQVDEVSPGGVYEAGDGLLDTNDELVFMAKDVGEQAGIGDWLANADAQAHTRYEVTITNPLAPSQKGWVYIYRSATLSPSPEDYVDWDSGGERIEAGSYVVGYDTEEHTGLDSLELNQSGVDAVDRTKLRASVTCWIGPNPTQDTYSEQGNEIAWDVTPTVDGRVRVGGGNASDSQWSYGSFFESRTVVDLDDIDAGPCDEIEIHWLRITSDWRDPVASGMAPAIYYDTNTPAGVAIDGSPDTVATTPVNAWKQISGAHGTLVEVQEIEIDTGAIANYYADDDTEFEPYPPTGDGLQFGDSGFLVSNPSGVLSFADATFILPAGQPNVGATYRSYYENPLQTGFTAQEVCWAEGVSFAYAPFPVFQGQQTTFTASVESGQQPFSYSWDFGDGATGQGNPISHGFDNAGSYTVTVGVTNACGTIEMTRHILVHVPGQAHLVFAPLAMRAGP